MIRLYSQRLDKVSHACCSIDMGATVREPPLGFIEEAEPELESLAFMRNGYD